MAVHFMIVSHLLLILHKKYSFISLCLKPKMWQKVAKFKGAEYFARHCMREDPLLECRSASKPDWLPLGGASTPH